MNIKRLVKLSFIIVSVLVFLIFSANTIALHKIQENNLSKRNISELVLMQENMNTLVEEILSANSNEELQRIEKEFDAFEKSFENINQNFFIKDEDDILDQLIKDIHRYPIIFNSLEKLSLNEEAIEVAFEKIFETQKNKIELQETFNRLYPKESLIRNRIEEAILQHQNITLVKDLGDMKYYSKEMLFQHKNEEYFKKWLSKIDTLNQHLALKEFKEYKQTAQLIGETVLALEAINRTEESLVKHISTIIDSSQNINLKIEQDIEVLSENFLDKVYFIVTVIFIITILFIIILSYKVNRNVALSVDEIEHKVEEGLKEIKNLNKEIEETQKEVIFTMGAIGESRSKETGNHVKRVAQYSKILALHYGLSSKEANMLKQASPMHDIGKVAIPDAILNKPGRFDEAERTIMETHAELGYSMLKHSDRPLLKMAAIISNEHHEKWDGTGYPQGKKGEDIHIYGRITAVADVFDALGSDRCYKKAWDDERIFKLFKEERGKQFDPKLVDIFFEHLDEFLKIRETFKD
ncbi:HD-GYP domain-containing protein [Candidatus Marinarcus aquaticus]|uniref:HD family phosphohydrolase n=1 Tax=Candidatus Marinarcus aquaticus TaxID=2044504 RepID=A0A4Q0XR17_9BACT|nr:HD domain-containing phosphohydrolase [Candidatus Marinarcus aquaticus]RXJ58142.1 HD family phosphohydrolase [Candidatus Marinarcus aquaticus]